MRKTSQNKPVESMHYCIQKLTLKLYDKNEQNSVIWLIILILFLNRATTSVNPALNKI